MPTNQDQVQLTLTAPDAPQEEPLELHLEGRATIEGHEIVHAGVPAEDMMQAFIYHHLVPMKNLFVVVAERKRPMPPIKFLGEGPVKLPAGGTATVRLSLPRGPLHDMLHFALNDPPEGISLESSTLVNDSMTLFLHADAGKAKPGQKGNLIVNVLADRPANPAGGKAADKKPAAAGHRCRPSPLKLSTKNR